MRLSFYQETKESEPELVSIKIAKQLLKEKGGFAFTHHIDRDGGVFEVSEIKLNQNNSTFSYNQHL